MENKVVFDSIEEYGTEKGNTQFVAVRVSEHNPGVESFGDFLKIAASELILLGEAFDAKSKPDGHTFGADQESDRGYCAEGVLEILTKEGKIRLLDIVGEY
jgi:hypothetical protein